MKNIEYYTLLGILLAIFILLFYGAIKWELSDIKKINNKPNIFTLSDKKERFRELIWYSSFNYENNIIWRSLFISCSIGILLVYVFLKFYASADNLGLNCVIMLIIIFLCCYLMQNYRSFHMYRVMANNVKKDSKILEKM